MDVLSATAICSGSSGSTAAAITDVVARLLLGEIRTHKLSSGEP